MREKGEIRYGGEFYPNLLYNIKGAPEKLYYEGNKNLLETECIAIVGTRKPTAYGRWAAYRISKRLAEAGLTIVSGMASGIDTLAHRGALDADGKTIAVLGCGIDKCFPAGNREIFEKIKEKGLALSEYPGTYPASRYTFPMRNRIISGLSEGVVVIEAGLKSGSLITAEFAGDQGRTVFAVPGNINSSMSIGTNKLIRDGAVPVSVVDDILADMGISTLKNKDFHRELDKDENMLLDIIGKNSEISIEKLCEISEMPTEKTVGIITVLEMKGIVCTSLGKIFIAK